MRAFLLAPAVAFRFLTILPVGPRSSDVVGVFPRSVGFFPLAGCAIGLGAALADFLLRPGLGAPVASVLVVAVLALLSGGLHLDGLADTMDGLFGSATRVERLAIMRGGGIGAFAAVALGLVLLLEWTALAWSGAAIPALIAAATVSRWAMSVALWAFPVARAEGLGHAFKVGLGPGDVLLATAVAATVLWFLQGPSGLVLFLPAAGLTAGIGALAIARLGGLAGDVYGAIGEVVLAATLVLHASLR